MGPGLARRLACIWVPFLALTLAACSGGSPTPSTSVTPTIRPATEAPIPTSTPVKPRPTPEPATVPRLESPAQCGFPLPDGLRVDCGYLVVPQDRRVRGGDTLRLHYAIFKSTSTDPRPDPVVYLSGGPGFGALEAVPLTFERRFFPFLAKRDFIMFDQRGTGLSEPALDCPEYTRTFYDLLDQDLTLEESDTQFLQALRKCHERLVQNGIDPEAYTSAENAGDVNDLRLALGYSEWNLYGVSYGTKLALITMRDYPQGIRAVILDSPYPLQVSLDTEIPANAQRAFDVLFQGCAAHVARPGAGPSCAQAYPDLEASFLQAVDGLNADPAQVFITNPLSGESFRAVLNGDGLARTLFQSLYATELLPLLPMVIDEALQGTFDTLAAIQGSLLAELDFASLGMQLSVQCGEEMRFITREELSDAAHDFPELGRVFAREANLDVCDFWGARPAEPVENEPVSSTIPTLVLSGEYDPITPPEWGRIVAEDLDNSFAFEFRGVGHGASGTGGCPLRISLEFLDEPTSEPDSSCMARMQRPDFVVAR